MERTYSMISISVAFPSVNETHHMFCLMESWNAFIFAIAYQSHAKFHLDYITRDNRIKNKIQTFNYDKHLIAHASPFASSTKNTTTTNHNNHNP